MVPLWPRGKDVLLYVTGAKYHWGGFIHNPCIVSSSPTGGHPIVGRPHRDTEEINENNIRQWILRMLLSMCLVYPSLLVGARLIYGIRL